ncbi:MAG TPA: redoxin domain-containing protein [Dehalococcoidales bacterium]|nr:redoxin domain-containing protein [Dehalococcoidales bacterium]
MAERNKPIAISEKAPDFTLKDQMGNDFTLSKQKGKRVLLSFHPLAWTDVCRNQMLSLEANFQKFAEMYTVPVGISIDSVPSKKAWADDMGLKNLRILADFWPHGAVSKAYGLFRENAGTSMRANVLVDEKGKVTWVKVYDIPQLPDINEVLAAVKKLAGE